jgi:FKBP-type peptidyl-prolyl cis-trans isomerase SlyD
VSDLAIEPNAHAVVDYELRDDDGDLVDASEAEGGEPIRYVHGYGMLVPGLEAALAGMRAGDERDVVVPADAGYGEYNDELVIEIDRGEVPNPTRVSVGDELVAESPDGEGLALTVIEVRDDTVIVDANHPLAGMTLRYHVKVRDVRPATDEEIAHAANDFDEAYSHEHGPDCDHSHEPLPLGASLAASLGGGGPSGKRRLS